MKMRFHSHGNEFNLHVNEISFSYERMSTKTRFEKEAKGNSKMAYCFIIHSKNISPFLKEFRHFALCFSLTQNNTISSPGFLGQQFNNLQRAALLTSLIQYGED